MKLRDEIKPLITRVQRIDGKVESLPESEWENPTDFTLALLDRWATAHIHLRRKLVELGDVLELRAMVRHAPTKNIQSTIRQAILLLMARV